MTSGQIHVGKHAVSMNDVLTQKPANSHLSVLSTEAMAELLLMVPCFTRACATTLSS